MQTILLAHKLIFPSSHFHWVLSRSRMESSSPESTAWKSHFLPYTFNPSKPISLHCPVCAFQVSLVSFVSLPRREYTFHSHWMDYLFPQLTVYTYIQIVPLPLILG